MIKATIQNSPYCTDIIFPCTEAELSKKLGELGIAPDHLAPVGTVIEIEPYEIGLTDCDVSLDALNYLAKRMDGMSEGERNQFLATLSCDEDKVGFGWGLKDIINLTFNLERFTLIEDTSDLEKVGHTHLLNVRGALSKSEYSNSEWLIEEGKKLLDSGKGIQTEYGLLFVNEENEFREIFNGTTFPVYYCDPNAIVSIEITYDGLTELVELPNEDVAIKKALGRLGADSLNSCKLEISSEYDITSHWWNKITELEKSKDLFGMNSLLKTEDVLMKNTSIFKREVVSELTRRGYDVDPNGEWLTVSMNGKPLVKINDKDIVYTNGSFYDNDKSAAASLSGIVRGIHDYCSVYEKSAPLTADGLSKKYRCLAEFNDTVLCARYDEYMGFEFVTWFRSSDGKSVTNGNYFSDYISAKENFAVRSCLINSNKLFDNSELAQLNRCVDFTVKHNGDLGFDECESLKKLNEKISDILPEPQQTDDLNMSM